MLFMIIERFRDDDMIPVYQRVRDVGRQLPEGLKYLDSWVEPNFGRCFQLMECDDLRPLQEWVLSWRGAGVTFEIVPVVRSQETREVVAPFLERAKERGTMSRRERIVTAVALATLLLWQTYAVFQAFRFAPNLSRLMAGVGGPLPWATRSFFATYRAWPLVPFVFGVLSFNLFRRREPSEVYLVLLLVSGAMAALALQAWVHEAFFAPLFTVLEAIG